MHLDDSLYNKPKFEGAKYVMSPPLRKKEDQEALWQGLAYEFIDVVSTDHCPFNLKQKELGKNDFSKIPNGIPGIENRLELLFSEGVEKGRISLGRFVDVTSTNAAKIFGLFPQKGIIAEGSDADLIIFDPDHEHTISAKKHHMNCDYSPYEGFKVKGKCKTVILRGKIAVDNGKILVKKNFGQFLTRKLQP